MCGWAWYRSAYRFGAGAFRIPGFAGMTGGLLRTSVMPAPVSPSQLVNTDSGFRRNDGGLLGTAFIHAKASPAQLASTHGKAQGIDIGEGGI